VNHASDSPLSPTAASVLPKPTFIDLFSGCGGFTLGMLRAGFDCLAAVDFNQQAVATLKANLADKQHPGFTPVRHALQRDLTAFPPAALAALIGTDRLDVIVGGPPCQGFSTARQFDGSNHGVDRLKDDPRRHLFRNFLEFVDHFQPKVFVIENVLGLRNAAGGRYFTAVQYEARILGRAAGRPGYRVHPQIERGEELGSPQKRRRQLIVGVRDDLVGYFNPRLDPAPRAVAGATLGDALLDLPQLAAGDGEDDRPYDFARRKRFFRKRGKRGSAFLFHVAQALQAETLRNHVARPHSERDLRDFKKIPPGRSSATMMRQGVEFEFPYDKTTFKDRYTRQHPERACSTIVAHLAKDGLMFIHPTQNRSFTPREAARVQTFPDWFVFPAPRTHSFRLIGNAVPPLIAEAVGLGILRYFTAQQASQNTATSGNESPNVAALAPGRLPKRSEFIADIPADRADAASRIHPFTEADARALRAMSSREFLRGWHALLWLFPHLHPDNAVEHGDDQHDEPSPVPELPKLSPRYVRSGWPVMLEPFGKEAWRRFEAEEFSDELFYCVDAQRAGMEARRRPASDIPTSPTATPRRDAAPSHVGLF
jgi:DNA (cytosine-5)-methyltransferase 1